MLDFFGGTDDTKKKVKDHEEEVKQSFSLIGEAYNQISQKAVVEGKDARSSVYYALSKMVEKLVANPEAEKNQPPVVRGGSGRALTLLKPKDMEVEPAHLQDTIKELNKADADENGMGRMHAFLQHKDLDPDKL
eukprot:7117430-Prymnesium_polylepis.1